MTDLRLGVALDGAGWYPAGPPSDDVLTAGYWERLAVEADVLDFITFEDTFEPPPGRARLDAVLLAARVAPLTRHAGLIPVATTTHTEPFHLSTALATLDFISQGRAGWQARVTGDPAAATLLGRRAPLGVHELFDEAADAVEVVRRLWDSWQDDAVIKDAATGRYIDRDRLHYIDFTGEFFAVRGPSIVPRPPQGQPVVAALAHVPVAYEFAARAADLVFVTDRHAVLDPRLKVYLDLVVFLDDDASAAEARRSAATGVGASDAEVFAGTPEQLAQQLRAWSADGLDGFRLRPADLPRDLLAITRRLVPLLGLEPRPGPLRERLGLAPAVNRYEGGRRG
jgi:alkanesulfonate monooxygenase SsuD/methylene tetrahydromethanopterin reductase-like flavin-dependent oxidoreductase (luciferase family)